MRLGITVTSIALGVAMMTAMPLGARQAGLAPAVTAASSPRFGSIQPGGGTTAARPKLAVLIVVDQMRADYVDRFKDRWTSGLKRLVTHGAWFTNAAYPYLATLTCVGHATIATGALPYRHGIIQNSWFDRTLRRVVTCTEDPLAVTVPYKAGEGIGESAARLRLPTFADELRRQRGGRVVSLALKARSAVMLAGRGGDAVTWLNESLDGWETSSAYGAAVPSVKAFIDANPIEADYGKSWTLLLPSNRYEFPDDLDGEAPPRGWTPLFPHVFAAAAEGKPDIAFYAQWERSPYADDYMGRFAAALVESLQLGRRDTTDVLAVSFSSPDLVGHAFGPRSQEVEDIYLRLDQTLGTLLDRLDALVGPDRYVLGLSSDHGVTDIPEQLIQTGRNGGRLGTRTVTEVIESRAQSVAGPGRYVAAISGAEVHFEPGMFDKLKSHRGGVDAVIRGLLTLPSIARVFRSEELVRSTTSRDALLRAAALSYVADIGGELVLALKPGWMVSGTGTTHGTANPDDQRVPIILYGSGVRPGQYRDAATPADLAPTLAALVGVTMPGAEGTVLRPALAAVPPARETRP
jgi:predicted AlkP superfamily pyrophosphatase or phosphodiesterase